MKMLKRLLIIILFPIILAYPTWHFFIKDIFYLPGPIYSTPDDSLDNMLKYSHVIDELSGYKIYIVKPALSIKLKGNRYVGPEGYSFQREKLYIGLLKNILQINADKVNAIICEETKIIIIFPIDQINQFN